MPPMSKYHCSSQPPATVRHRHTYEASTASQDKCNSKRYTHMGTLGLCCLLFRSIHLQLYVTAGLCSSSITALANPFSESLIAIP
jgi:hypothetical protein